MKCPSFEQMIDHLEGRVEAADAARISSHLSAGCPQCAETQEWYQRINALVASDDSVEPPSWVFKRAVRIFENRHSRPRLAERIGQIVASLVFDSFARPAVAGIRSTETTSRQLLYRAGDYSIDLQIAPSEGEQVELIGQVLKEGEAAFESVSSLRLRVSSEGRAVGAATTNEMGEFKIGGIDYGVYDLCVEIGDGIITVPGLSVVQS